MKKYKLTQREQYLLIGGVLLIGLVLIFCYLLVPTLSEVQAAMQELTGLRQQVMLADRQAQRLPELQQQEELRGRQLSERLIIIPRHAAVPQLLTALENTAKANNVRMTIVAIPANAAKGAGAAAGEKESSFIGGNSKQESTTAKKAADHNAQAAQQQKQSVDVQQVQQASYRVSVRGSLAGVIGFLQDVENYPRLLAFDAPGLNSKEVTTIVTTQTETGEVIETPVANQEYELVFNLTLFYQGELQNSKK